MRKKSYVAGAALAFFLGPFGLLYTSFWAAVLIGAFDLAVIAAIKEEGLSTGWGFLIWPVNIGAGLFMVHRRNRQRKESIEQLANELYHSPRPVN